MSAAPRRGFTFIEVICILLVVSLGLMAAVGLMSYGLQLAARSRGEQLGLPTAVSVAQDPTPLLAPRNQPGWTYTPYPISSTGTQVAIAHGVINGFWVERTETSTDDDIIASDAGVVYMRSAAVVVDVFDASAGQLVASFTTRIIRQRGSPGP
jgi:hypothetical protein